MKIRCGPTVRDKPFLVLAAALGCAVVCIRICVTVWAGLTVCTATGVLSTDVITVGVATGSTVVCVVVVVDVVAAWNKISRKIIQNFTRGVAVLCRGAPKQNISLNLNESRIKFQ